MVGFQVVLGVVIASIYGAWFPIYMELVLLDSILDPMESHVHCLGHFLFDAFVGYADCCGIVYLYWGGRLRMIHFNQSGAYWNPCLAVKKKRSVFCFGGRCHDIA